MDTREKLSSITITLHWVVGVLMLYMVMSGLFMEDIGIQWLFDSHTSFGVAILLVVIPRVIWRYSNGWPEHVGDYTQFEKICGKAVHWALLIATLIMPLSGMMMAIGGGHGLHFFSFDLLAATSDPANPGENLVIYPLLDDIGDTIHSFIGETLLPAAIILHIVGALKHHLIDKDRTLLRMLGR
ncbi:cytochrome b [Vibrio coralliilyticus]|uniref:cytochrome b n=1 Tax=Vibrio coralliilyticus TaxID=190893 RepID=UPI000BAB12AF|nr:cytochrome b [Vibrio coralliilyticus]NOI57450.1 cytochrome b [Vibrio coralliilyticus]PAT67900.1 RNA methyltransferase [Vibrio coralliilyticus]